MEFVLNALAMGYRPLWNAQRRLAGVQLFLHDTPGTLPDTAHLLHLLEEIWSPTAPWLLLSPQSPQLLRTLLTHARPGVLGAIEVRAAWLDQDPSLQDRVDAAAHRGVSLIWRGALHQLPDAAQAAAFVGSLLHMAPRDAAALMQLHPDAPLPEHLRLLPGQMYEDLHSQVVLHRCLEAYDAQAVAGWPAEDVLHRLAGSRVLHPMHDHVLRLMQAVDGDQPLEIFEAILSEDPLLAYRLMLFANSAALGARHGIDSLRRTLVMLGYGPLKTWLAAQLVHASHEADLQPIRWSTVMRAQLTARLLDAGVSQELRSEVYLCGLFSRLDEMLNEPLSQSLGRLPLSERIADAAVRGEGPYAPSLQIAQALEREDGGRTVRALCAEHEIPLEHVNRSLLRQISEWTNHPPRW